MAGQCNHDINEAEDTSKYLNPGSPAMERLREIVLDKKLVIMKYYCHFMHTYVLESFHNNILVYSPKRVSFGYDGMKARCKLAMLDHNFHQDRPMKCSNGNVRWCEKMWSTQNS
jgi:hypothetical protein